jgi:sporulation protein YlmC with PRC-barrel domain
MARIVIAKQLAGKKIITNDGEELGKLIDLSVQEQTGKIVEILVEPNLDNSTAREMRKDDGLLVISYEAVLAASDHVIVDKRNIK